MISSNAYCCQGLSVCKILYVKKNIRLNEKHKLFLILDRSSRVVEKNIGLARNAENVSQEHKIDKSQ